jgi:hypothetical protein
VDRVGQGEGDRVGQGVCASMCVDLRPLILGARGDRDSNSNRQGY